MSPKPNTTPGRAGASSSGAAIFSAPVISVTSPRCSFALNTLCRNLSYRKRAPSQSNKCGRFEAGDLLTSNHREIRSGVNPHLCVHTRVHRQRAVVTPGQRRAERRGSQEPESNPEHSCCCLLLISCLLPACCGTLGLRHHGSPSCPVQMLMLMRSRAPSSATWLEDQSRFGGTVALPQKLD